MTPAILYIARASLYLAIFYAFYLLVMRKTSLFRFNRVVLLAGTLVCHLLPLLRLRTVTVPDFSGIQVGELQMASEEAGQAAEKEVPDPSEVDDSLRQVDRDRVHADNLEESRPLAPSLLRGRAESSEAAPRSPARAAA